MRRTSILLSTLYLTAMAVFGQTTLPESQIAQSLLTEIRQLRQDLQTTAATIQRVQIVMYRVQAAASLLNRATERLENTRGTCSQVQAQRKMITTEVEQAESRRRDSQNPVDQRTSEEMLQQLKSSIERLVGEEQHCQIEQADAEFQFRGEQAKMNELQGQLDSLDKLLAAQSRQ